MVQVALVATGGLLGSELVLGVISLMHPVCPLPCVSRTDVLTGLDIRIAALASVPNLYRV